MKSMTNENNGTVKKKRELYFSEIKNCFIKYRILKGSDESL